MTLTSTIETFNSWDNRVLVTDVKNAFIKISSRSVTIVFAEGNTYTDTKTYHGSLGTSPSSGFRPTDIAVNRCGNILVSNDNAFLTITQFTFWTRPWLSRSFWWQKRMVSTDRQLWHWTQRDTCMWGARMIRYMLLIISIFLTRTDWDGWSFKRSALKTVAWTFRKFLPKNIWWDFEKLWCWKLATYLNNLCIH